MMSPGIVYQRISFCDYDISDQKGYMAFHDVDIGCIQQSVYYMAPKIKWHIKMNIFQLKRDIMAYKEWYIVYDHDII